MVPERGRLKKSLGILAAVALGEEAAASVAASSAPPDGVSEKGRISSSPRSILREAKRRLAREIGRRRGGAGRAGRRESSDWAPPPWLQSSSRMGGRRRLQGGVEVVWGDFETGLAEGWEGGGEPPHGGGIEIVPYSVTSDVGGDYYLQAAFASGDGTAGYWGGLFKVEEDRTAIDGTDTFSFYINPTNPTGVTQVASYTLEIYVSNDLENDVYFQYDCFVSASANSCAQVDGGWQKVEIPLTDFMGIDGSGSVLTAPVDAIEFAVIAIGSTAVNFGLDNILFEGPDGPAPDTPDTPTPAPVAGNGTAPTPAAPVSTPVSAPVDAPVSTPVSDPVSTPVTAPVSAPVTAPVSAPASAPVTAPATAPETTPATAPVSSPVSAPVAAPDSAPVSAPVGPPPTSAPVTDPVGPEVATAAPTFSPVTEEPTSSPTGAPVATDPPTSSPVTPAPVTEEPTSSPVTEEPTSSPTGAPVVDDGRIDCPKPFDEPCTSDDLNCCLTRLKAREPTWRIDVGEKLEAGKWLCREEYMFGVLHTGSVHQLRADEDGKCTVLWTATEGEGDDDGEGGNSTAAVVEGDYVTVSEEGNIGLYEVGGSKKPVWQVGCSMGKDSRIQMIVVREGMPNHRVVILRSFRKASKGKKKKKKKKKGKKRMLGGRKKGRIFERDWWVTIKGDEGERKC